MGQALYRKYRSKGLSEIVGQEHITATLETALKRGAISHAYLLTGPHGVGKTSIARILAHQINELPYEGEKTHLDIIEIDAASNRRIDEIRDLRDKVHNAPTSAKYKVYIIDEVHMLTREAFNALLKTLEEPPAHAVFILATTDAHKLPETIISRTQHFTFRPISTENIAKHLQFIAQQENIDIAPEALTIIAQHSRGTFRDSISMLEQAAGLGDAIDVAAVQRMLGIPPEELTNSLFTAFTSNDSAVIVDILHDLALQGFQPDQIASQFSRVLRTHLLDGSVDPARATATLKDLLEVPQSPQPGALLEIVLLSHINAQQAKPAPQTSPAMPAPEPEPIQQKKPQPEPALAPEEAQEAQDSHAAEPPSQEPAETAQDASWAKVLQELKKSHSTLYSVARMADCTVADDEVVLLFQFPFHKKKFDNADTKKKLLSAISKIYGRELKITTDIKKKHDKPKPKAQKKTKPPEDLDTISNIFGGGEVLES